MSINPDPASKKSQSDEELLAQATPIEDLEALDQEAPKEKSEEVAPAAIDLVSDDEGTTREIRTFDRHKRSADIAKRKTNVTNTGATHVRTFVSKLRMDAIEHLDQQINEWLEQHPEYEVKNITVCTGILTGKLREEALFMSVWV